MFCPKCATQNIDGARFCRSCGADVSLVPMAMSGRLPEAPAPMPQPEIYTGRRGRRGRGRREPSYESAFGSLGTGFAFLIISIAIWQMTSHGVFWWYWMLIPAFTMMFKGIGEIARLRNEKRQELPAGQPQTLAQPPQAAMPPAPAKTEFAPYNTSELMPPPPSVTEGTTRLLGQEGPTRVFEIRAELPKQDS